MGQNGHWSTNARHYALQVLPVPQPHVHVSTSSFTLSVAPQFNYRDAPAFLGKEFTDVLIASEMFGKSMND
jgi:hypothetical protein